MQTSQHLLGQIRSKCNVQFLILNLIILVMKKIGLDVVNLDFIFHVKCDHFSISLNENLKMEMQQTFA